MDSSIFLILFQDGIVNGAVYALLALWGGIVMGIYTIGLTMIGERFKGSQLVGANALYVMLYALGMLIGPAAQGVALDVWDPHGLVAALGGIFGLYLLFLLWPRTSSVDT